MKAREHNEQTALFHWCAVNRKKYPELDLLFAIPNGGHRDIRTASRLKAEGVKAGVPDLFLPVEKLIQATGPVTVRFNGLFIEMKVKPNKPTPAQQEWIERLRKKSYCVAVCYSWLEAVEVIRTYLGK